MVRTTAPPAPPSSSFEARTLRFTGQIIGSLIVASILGLGGFAFHTDRTLAQLGADHERYDDVSTTVIDEIKNIKRSDAEVAKTQKQTEVTLKGIETKQEHVVEEIGELKEANKEILRILREESQRHSH